MRAYHVNGWRRALAFVPLLPLLACVPAPAPAPETAPPAPAPAPAKVQAAKPPRPPLDATWSFAVSESACSAHASAGATTLAIDIADDGTVVIEAAPGADAPAYLRAARHHPPLLRVAAEGETWQWRLRANPAHRLEARLAPSKAALARILLMLRGGIVTMSAAPARDHALRLAPAGSSGAAWFACARDRVRHGAGADADDHS